MDVKRLWFESIGIPTADMAFVKKKKKNEKYMFQLKISKLWIYMTMRTQTQQQWQKSVPGFYLGKRFL